MIKFLLYAILCVICWPLAVALAVVWVPYKAFVVTGRLTYGTARAAAHFGQAVTEAGSRPSTPMAGSFAGEHGPELIKLPRGARVIRQDTRLGRPREAD